MVWWHSIDAVSLALNCCQSPSVVRAVLSIRGIRRTDESGISSMPGEWSSAYRPAAQPRGDSLRFVATGDSMRLRLDGFA